MNRAISTQSKRTILASTATLILAVTFLSIHASPFYPAASTNSVTSSISSWNPMVNCTPTVVTVEQILGNQTNALGGASENGSIYNPGITSPYGPENTKRWLTPSSSTPPGWISPGPSCTITNAQGQVVSAFVQINGVQRGYRAEEDWNSSFMPINGGTAYRNGQQSDSTFNILTAGYGPCTSTNTTSCMHTLHAEIDHDWKGAGYCGPNTACDNNTLVSETTAYKSLIDVQGFVSWDPDHLTESDHSFSGWELHPLTAWRISNTSSDFTLSASPSPLAVFVGHSASSVISVNTFNLFTGNVSFTTIVSASLNSTGPAPTTAMIPTTIFIKPGGAGSSTLTVTAATTTTGNYTVAVSGSNGTISRTVNVAVYVTDFGIEANPSSLSVSVGSSGQSTISLSSINGFAGNVSLTVHVSPASTTASLSTALPTASLSSSVVSLAPRITGSVNLTVSTSLLTLPGTYTVTLTAVGNGVSHTTTITVAVTVAGLAVGGLV
jgi:hypothetical protein